MVKMKGIKLLKTYTFQNYFSDNKKPLNLWRRVKGLFETGILLAYKSSLFNFIFRFKLMMKGNAYFRYVTQYDFYNYINHI